MYNNKKQPIYLNLLEIRLPVGGVVSILHRVSGVVLVLALPAVLFLLDLSLQSEQQYQTVTALLATPAMQAAGVVLVWFLAHHLLAGVRHLLLDLDIGIDRDAARRSAWATLGIGLLVAVTMAICVW
jgi:succinate dehydrogenase / fumarate reductase cytochrome b subunit